MESAVKRLYYSFFGQEMPASLRNFAEADVEQKASDLFDRLQRREEYGSKALDSKGRFKAEDSEAFRDGKITLPELDLFMESLFPGAYAATFSYQCLPTFDIDNAYAFRGKGLMKNVAGMAKNLVSDTQRARSRFQTWLNASKDPYDTYAYILETCQSFGLRPLFFIQMGSYNNGYDSNIPFRKKEGRALLDLLSAHADIGLHPSYASNFDKQILYREYTELNDILGKKVIKSRQHFLMLKFPDTYRNLLELGIQEDYSMGWASQTGYRAGTCRPFLWYDLEQNSFPGLTVYPFTNMDGTLHEYLKLNPDRALEQISEFIEQTRAAQGVYTPLWHNHTVNNRWEWNKWQPVFEQMLALSCP